MHKHEWILKRNCSFSPRQLALAYAAPCLVPLILGVIFALRGAWYVLAFAMLEMFVAALAFLRYARHATDHEHIALSDDCLLVELVEAGEVRQTRLHTYWLRVAEPKDETDLIKLEAKGVKVGVGRFVTEETRRQVAQELREELRDGLFSKNKA